ncbi:hypothetical protein [Kitasatospora sp. NPDC094011]
MKATISRWDLSGSDRTVDSLRVRLRYERDGSGRRADRLQP